MEGIGRYIERGECEGGQEEGRGDGGWRRKGLS